MKPAVPLMTPANERSSERSKTSVEPSPRATLPVIDPTVPPAPMESVPVVIVVPSV
jgi:hypothetical protein